MDVGESWVYRARQVDPLIEVRVVRHGDRRPPRVLVRFVADEFEGREEWVSPARLKVPWSQVEVFIDREQKWAAVVDASPIRDTVEDCAMTVVFEQLIDTELAGFGYGANAGVTTISDVDGLAAFLDVEPFELYADPLVFVDNDALVVPWAITERIVTRAAQLHVDVVLRYVDEEEAKQQQRMRHGESSPSPLTGEYRHVDAEWFVQRDEDPWHRPCRGLLRRWCGAESVERRDELKELRKEVHRLGLLVTDAVITLRRAGMAKEADRIELDLGVTVEQLRGR